MQTFQYKLAFQVRDYECNFQGIVGHATYLNYLLHARDEFVKRFGLDAAILILTYSLPNPCY